MKRKISGDYSYWIVPISIFVTVCDFYIKQIVVGKIELYRIIPVINGFFNLTHTRNHGVAFGLFSNIDSQYRSIFVISLTIFAVAAILFILSKLRYSGVVAQLSFGLILGGALGNVIDRFNYGAVIDYLDFYYHSYHWPAFNLADSAICLGVGLLILLKPAQETKTGDQLGTFRAKK